MNLESSGAEPERHVRPTPVALRVGRELTKAQRSLWASQRQNPTQPVQNMAEAAHFDGPIDADRLGRAFAAVVAESDALRTRIIVDRGEPRVVVGPSTIPAETRTIELPRDDFDRWARDRVRVPIDTTICSYDSVVLTHEDGTATWYLGLHHTVTDAASSTLVFEATAKAYADTDVTLGSYYRWADAKTAGTDRRTQRAVEHWHRRQPPPALGALYLGDVSPRCESHRFQAELDAELLGRIDERLAGELRMLSEDLGWSTLLVTATAALLHRVSGNDEFAIGLPVHNRNDPTTREIIGPVMEVYPIDIRIDPGDSFAQLHQRIGQSMLSTLRHTGAGTGPSTADCRVIVNLLPSSNPLRFGDVPAEVVWIHSGAVDPGHLLRVQFSRFGLQPALHLDINEACAVGPQSVRMVEHFGRLLEAIVTDPTQPIGSVVLPAAEELAVIEAWGTGAGAALADSPADMVVPSLRASLQNRNSLVMRDASGSATGSELWDRVTRVASSLRASGIGPGARVAVDMARSIDLVVGIYATLVAGASYVPLDPSHPDERRRRLVERAGCALVLDPPLLARLESRTSDSPGLPLGDPGPDDEAYLLFTSGSTGEPKGVPISHQGLADYLAFARASYVPEGPPPVGALFSAVTFDLTVTSLFVPVLAGGSLVVIEPDGPAGLRLLAENEDITWAKATPSHLELLVRMLGDGRGQHGLRTLVVGGEAFGTHLAERLWAVLGDVAIFNEYGPTEAVVGCMIHRAEPGADQADVPIGIPAPGVELRVLDAYDQPVPIGAVGQLHIAHRGLTTGYLGPVTDPGEQPFVELDGRRFYRSGDLVRLCDDQTLVYLGRADEQVKVGGIRLDPTEVEHALTQHPAVGRAVVRLWEPAHAMSSRHCVRCGLPDNVPGVHFDADGVCDSCHAYDAIRPQAASWFRTENDLRVLRDTARSQRTGDYDAIHLLSGGKDSTYALYRLVEMGFDVLCLTLDNGFISEGAKDNVRRSIADLGIDHEFITSEVMNEIFRDSLERHSNVCHGCYKTIYTLATTRAVEVGAPLIVTGLSRGQLFETRLVPEQFAEGRFDPDAIDAATLAARRVYHRLDDGPNRLLDTTVFDQPEAAGAAPDVFDRVQYVDFYRYVDVELADLLEFLEKRAPWTRPADTGRSTNCLINAAGIHNHIIEQGFHNYAVPYAWDVRLGHKTRHEALAELDDRSDLTTVTSMLETVGHIPRPRRLLTAWIEPAGLDGAHLDGAHLDGTALRTFLAGKLPKHAVPAAFVLVDEIKLTSNGKVDTAALPAPKRVHRTGPSLYVSAQSPLESTIIGLWEAHLAVEPIGIDDDFFALGGDSLAALRMVVELSSLLGKTIREDLAFLHATPRQLAAAIELLEQSEDAPSSRPAGDPPPLSSGEQSLLFEHFADPADPRYNVGRRYRIAGPIDADRFVQALRAVIARHVPLHWTFSEPRIRLTPEKAIDCTIEPGQPRLDPAAFADRARRLHLEPFDLEAGPLGRCLIGSLDDGGTGIALVFHHVSIDAATFDDLWSQVEEIYTGEQLAPLVIDYADHTSWQERRWAHDRETPSDDPEFWSSPELAQPVAQLQFDLDEAGSDGYVQRAASVGLGQLRVGVGRTAFATCLAALATTLRRYSDGDRLGIAITSSTRDHPLAQGLVGYYLNTLPLVVTTNESASLQDLGRQCSNLIGRSLGHRTYPYARIVADRRRLGLEHPHASIMLAFEELAPARLGSLDAEHEILASGSAVTDATFFIQARGDELTLGLEYAGTFLSAAAAADVLAEFDHVLRTACESPDLAIGVAATNAIDAIDVLELLDDTEQQQILHDWNRPVWGHGQGLVVPDRAIHQLFEEFAVSQPDHVAVVASTGSLSYHQLERRSNLVAHELVVRGVGPGVRVGLVAERHPDTVVGVLAILKAGAAYVPIDPDYPSSRVTQMVEDAELAVLLGRGETADAPMGQLTDSILVDLATIGTEADPPDPGPPLVEHHPDLPAYVIFTSGSTGRPKGVVVSHRNIAASTAARSVVYPDSVGRFLLLSSFAFDSSMVGLFWSLCTGATLVLPDLGTHDDVGQLAEQIERDDVSHLLTLPSFYRLLLDETDSGRLSSLRTVIVAGEECPATLAPAHARLCPHATLWNEYGPTEATVWSHAHQISDDGGESPVPIGRVIPGMTAHVLDRRGRPVPVGQPGELVLGGAGISLGYLGRPDLTEERFVALRGPLDDGTAHYRTGDRVQWLNDGTLAFLGRIDDQVKIRGHRIELAEVERAAARLPGVHEAAAGVLENAGSNQLGLWISMAAGATQPEASAVRRQLREVLPEAMIPSRVIVVEHFPRTPNGKIDRSTLPPPETGPDWVEDGTMTRPDALGGAVGPNHLEHPIETLLCRIWAEVLGVGEVGRHQDFFDLGGDSIMSIQIVARLRRSGWRLSTRDVFDHPTVARLATRAEPLVSSSAEQGLLTGDVDLLPIQHWFFEHDLHNPHHWNQSRWIELASGTDGDRLLQAARALPAQHDGLRLRIHGSPDGRLVQRYQEDDALLVSTEPDLDSEARKKAAAEAEAALDIERGPVMAIVAFPAVGDVGPQIFVTVHHLVMDAVSWQPLLEDWASAYAQLGRGETVVLPAKSTSVRQWADQLIRWTEADEFSAERALWHDAGVADRSTAPSGSYLQGQTETVTVTLDRDTTATLIAGVGRGTPMQHVLLAALAHGAESFAIDGTVSVTIEGHGREDGLAHDLDLSRSVGWFTSLHPVEVPLGADPVATLDGLAASAAGSLHHGLGYGVHRWLDNEATARPLPPIVCNYLGQIDRTGPLPDPFETLGPLTAGIDPHNHRTHDLGLMAAVSNGRLQMTWDHHPDQIPPAEVRAIADKTCAVLTILAADSQGGLSATNTTRFDLVDFDNEELDALSDLLDGLDG